MATRGLSVFVSIGAKLGSSIGATASAVEKRFGLMNKRIRLASAETSAALGVMRKEHSGLLALGAAGGIVFGVKSAIGAGAAYDHELQSLRNAGRTTGEVAAAIKAANRTILELPTTTLASNLSMINETVSAFGNYSHALENVGRNQKLAFLLNNTLGGSADATTQIGSLIRMLEMRGAANDPKRYSAETELAYKAIQFSKGRANGESFRAFGSTANPLIKSLSDDYLYKIAPSLMTEYGADQAGTMHQALANQLMGKVGIGGKVYAQGWAGLGLLDSKQAKHAKDGSVNGWKPGAIAGTNLFFKNPLEWSEKYLIPALQRHGVNTSDPVALQTAIAKLASRNTAGRLLTALTSPNDIKRLHKDSDFTGKVPGIDKATLQTLLNDPTKGAEAVKAAFTNLEASISGPILIPLARGLIALAGGLDRVALVFEAHPAMGKGLAGLALGLGALSAYNLAKFSLGLIIPFAKIGNAIVGAMTWLRGGAVALRLFFAVLTGPEILAGIGAFALAAWPVVAVIGALGLALAFIVSKWGGIKAFFSGFADGFMKGLGPAMPALKGFGEAIKAFGMTFKPLADFAGAAFGLIGKIFAPANAANWHKGGESFGEMIGGVISKFIDLIEKIGKAEDGLRNFLGIHPDAVGSGGRGGPHRALGGSVSGGSRYTINERGEEMFIPGRSGTIINAGATAALIAAMSGGMSAPAAAAPMTLSPTIVIQGSHDPAATARAVEEVLCRMAREARGSMND